MDAVYYINLDRSTDRRAAFLARVAAVDWPWPAPIRFPAVDEAPPAWWLSNRGTWGCLRSHLAVYYEAILQGHRSFAVFEDDVVFSANFGEAVRGFAAAVPSDWGQLYFGGSHFTSPKRVNDQVSRVTSCNGAFAYALRGEAIAAPLAALARFPRALRDPAAHVDTLWAALHHFRRVIAYCPTRWMAGHAAGPSDRLGGGWSPEEWFQLSEQQPQQH